MNDILDDFNQTNETTFKLVHFLVPFLIALLLVWSIYIRFTSGYILFFSDWVAYSGVLVMVFLYFVKKEVYMYGLSAILLLGVLNFYGLTPFHYGVRVFSIPFQPILVILSIIHLIVFKNYFKSTASIQGGDNSATEIRVSV